MLPFLACKIEKPTPKGRTFDHYTQAERDSIAERFKNISYYMLQPSEAHRRYKDSALIVNPNDIESRSVWSYSYKKRGEHIQAMKILNEATEQDIQNNSKEILEYRAWSLLYYYRDYEGAIRDIDLIEKISKQKYNVCWGEPCGLQKGQAFYKLGRYDEAIQELYSVNAEEAKLGMDTTSNFLNFFYLGRCFHEKGDLQSAMQQYQHALDDYDKFSEAHFQMGRIYKQMDNKTKAKKYFETAADLLSRQYKMEEPYFERFDELFAYMIEDELKNL